MRSSRFAAVAFLLVVSTPPGAVAQVFSQPTPPPLVTAESERWYLNGDPITYEGNIYYPAGAQIHFNANEMVRSGSFNGVPLYIRTTIEPYSIVYVPLRGGLMQPYERRRAGDLAGTVGSTTPTLSTAPLPEAAPTMMVRQAAGAPTRVGNPNDAFPAGTSGTTSAASPAQPVGTSGREAAVPSHTRIGPKPRGLNALFVEFRDRRWYAAGKAIPYDRGRMIQIGEHHGFPVYVDRATPEGPIYIPAAAGGTMLMPYAASRRR